MNFISKNAVEISPEVLINSWLYASLDMPGKKEAIVNVSLMKGWRARDMGCKKQISRSWHP
jgi:hypothetical protein